MSQWAVFLNHVTELKQTARGNFSWRYALSKNGNSSSALSHTFVAKTRELPSVSMNWPVLPLIQQEIWVIKRCLSSCMHDHSCYGSTDISGRSRALFNLPSTQNAIFYIISTTPPDRGRVPRSGEPPPIGGVSRTWWQDWIADPNCAHRTKGSQ